MNTRLYKNINLSLFIFETDVLLCGRDEWRQGQTAILTQVILLTIAARLSHLGLLSQQAGSHFGILSPTELDAPGHLLILFSNVHLLSLFLFTQVHLLIDNSVECQYITVFAGRLTLVRICERVYRRLSLMNLSCNGLQVKFA